MPNWCANTVELFHEDSTKIDGLEQALKRVDNKEDEYEDVLNYLRPNPAGEWDYGWSVENWGTKWDIRPHFWERQDENSIVIDFDSAWAPPTVMYEYLYENGWSVSAKFEEPGMAFVGEWEDGNEESYEYDFSNKDWAEDVPQHLIEYAGLDTAYEDYLEWQDEDEAEVD